jgi:hypothetical protein
MFAVDDIEDVVARLRTHGAELVGELASCPGRPLAPRLNRDPPPDAFGLRHAGAAGDSLPNVACEEGTVATDVLASAALFA